jgi:hypothetical protein
MRGNVTLGSAKVNLMERKAARTSYIDADALCEITTFPPIFGQSSRAS